MPVEDHLTPVRISLKDLKTEAGNRLFESYSQSAFRYIKSQGVYGADAEDLKQEASLIVLKKLNDDPLFAVDAGYFIKVAFNILHEFWRKKGRFLPADADDQENDEQPLDADQRLKSFDSEKERTFQNECFNECFVNLQEEDQILLYRYEFNKDEHFFESDESSAGGDFFRPFLDSLKDAFRIFAPFSRKHQPMSVAEKASVRVRVLRRRKILWECWKNCLERKKGLD